MHGLVGQILGPASRKTRLLLWRCCSSRASMNKLSSCLTGLKKRATISLSAGLQARRGATPRKPRLLVTTTMWRRLRPRDPLRRSDRDARKRALMRHQCSPQQRANRSHARSLQRLLTAQGQCLCQNLPAGRRLQSLPCGWGGNLPAMSRAGQQHRLRVLAQRARQYSLEGVICKRKMCWISLRMWSRTT